MRYRPGFLLSGAVALALALPAVAADLPETTADGLVRVRDSRSMIAYVKPNADWAKYKSVAIQALVIPNKVRDAAPRGTRPNFGESYVLRDQDIAAIQKLFAEEVSEAFKLNGFQVVTMPGPDTLIVSSQLLNITLNAPLEDTRQNYMAGRTFSEGFGSVAIETDLADGESNSVIAMVAGRRYPHQLWGRNNRARNVADARIIFKAWAREISDAIKRRAAAPT
jgi:hypothetical protein